jgi:hypothetical protein
VATPILAWLKERQPRYRSLRERAAADLVKAAVVAPVPPVVAGEPADVPVDGEDVDPGDDVPEAPTTPAPAPARTSAPTPTSSRSVASGTSASRGTSNPRGRQQRGKKRR